MNIKIINEKEAISTVKPGEKFVHFAFRPSLKDVLELMKIAPELRLVQLSKSYNATIAKAMIDLFEMKDVVLVVGDVWGHRTDVDEYFRVPIDRIAELLKDKKSIKDISFLTKVDEPLIDFVLLNE